MTRTACASWSPPTARRGFLGDLLPYLGFLGLLLVGGSWLKIRVSLAPLAEVADRVQALTHERRSRIGTDDLTEALGALLENAMQHAASQVVITVALQSGQVALTIRDDGPGVPAHSLARLSQRGLRLDRSGEGQGIGLAIVNDIVDAANGHLDFSNADPGLCVRLTLAAVPTGR